MRRRLSEPLPPRAAPAAQRYLATLSRAIPRVDHLLPLPLAAQDLEKVAPQQRAQVT